jgi:hypothetical protein
MIYYRKTLFGSGPKLTAVHLPFSKLRSFHRFSLFFKMGLNDITLVLRSTSLLGEGQAWVQKYSQ